MSRRQLSMENIHRFSVKDYQKMIEVGVLHKYTRVELIRGRIYEKGKRSPLSASVHSHLSSLLSKNIPDEWHPWNQAGLALEAANSQPEPDIAFHRGNVRDFSTHYPEADDCGLIIEVSETSLEDDRNESQSIYAESQIPQYWIVNLIEMQIEVYTEPSGPCAKPAYANRNDYLRGSSLPLILDGKTIMTLNVDDILPEWVQPNKI